MTAPTVLGRRAWRLAAGMALSGAVLGAVVLGAGCGYRAGVRLQEGRTLGVEIFDNSSRTELAPGLERDLHREVSTALIRLVDAALVPPSDADRVITGRILSYHRRPGVRDAENRLLETGLGIEVQAEVRDRAGTVLRSAHVSSQSGYVLDRYEAEREAEGRVLGNIAERLVLDLIAPLDYEPGD